jgi:uridine kinase
VGVVIYKHPPQTATGSTTSRNLIAVSSTGSERHKRPYLIGVAGGSNSGKTTIAEKLAELIGSEHLSLMRLDSYYISRSEEPFEVRAAANYDHPDAFDWDLLNDHLAALTAGATVEVPVYDYANHDRSGRAELVGPGRVIVVEGILVLWEPRLRDRFDLKIFVDTPADLRVIRRLRRDVAERGRTPDSILDQYLATVRPSHELFIEPSKRHADVIVPEGGLNRPALEVLLARVRELATN